MLIKYDNVNGSINFDVIEKIKEIFSSDNDDNGVINLDFLKEYNQKIDEASDKTSVYKNYLEQATGATREAIEATNGETVDLKKYSISAKSASVATQLFNAALNALIIFAVVTAIKLLIQGLDSLSDSLEDVENRIDDNKKDLDEYKSKIEELTKQLRDRINELEEELISINKANENNEEE